MSRTVHCALLKTDAEGLDFAPWPGALGQRIYAEISKQAWQRWLTHQTMLINEYRLNPLDAKDRAYLSEQMEKFLFLGEVTNPPGYMQAHGSPEPPA
ncbi:MAG: oxidative damage protection protein [Rhodanobacter sp.]